MKLYACWVNDVPQITGFHAHGASANTIELAWDKVDCPGSVEVKYDIMRKEAPDGDWEEYATTKTNRFLDTKVKTGVRYDYSVRAKITVGEVTFYGAPSDDYATTKIYQVKKLDSVALNAGQVKLTWDANYNKNVYYQVYVSTKKNSGYKLLATVKNGKTSYIQNILPSKSGKRYYYKVRAIAKDYTGKWHYGPYSKVNYAYPRVNVPINFSVKATGKHTAKCVWSKVIGKNIKYQVYRATKKTGKYRRVATVSKNRFINRGLKSYQKYYYAVRAVQTVNGHKYYSKFTKVDYAYPR